MHFDPTISLGNMLSAVGMVAGLAVIAWRVLKTLDNRLQIFQDTLQSHAEALKAHDMILSTYEIRLFDLVGVVQRLVGRLEGLDHIERGRKN